MPPPPTSICPTVLVSKIRDIVIYEFSEILRTIKFKIFLWCVLQFLDNLLQRLIFQVHREITSLHIGPSEKVLYLMLDLLKSLMVLTYS